MLTVTITFMPTAPKESVTIFKVISGACLDRVYVARLQDGTSRTFPIEHVWEITEVPDRDPADQPAKTASAPPRKKP